MYCATWGSQLCGKIHNPGGLRGLRGKVPQSQKSLFTLVNCRRLSQEGELTFFYRAVRAPSKGDPEDPGTACGFLVNSRMDFSDPSWAPSSSNQRLLQKGNKSVLKKASLSRGHLRSLQEPSTAWLTHSRERTDPNTHGLEAGQQQIKNSPFQEAKVQILPTASAGKHRSPRSERLTISLATAQRSKEGAVTSPLLQGSDPPPFSEGCSL